MREERSAPAASHLVRRASAPEPPILDPALRRRIYRRILTLVKNTVEAEDLTQETLVRVYRGLPDFRGESSLTTWAVRIAQNLVRDRRRSASHAQEAGKPVDEADLENLADFAAPD